MAEKIAALYLRLSDEDKNGNLDESNSISAQRELLKAYIQRREELAGYRLMEFCDDGYSGTNFERPQIQRLLALVRRRAISCILVKDLSRFGRNYIEVGNYLEQVFPFLGIRFVAVNDGYDSDVSGTTGEFMDTAFKNLVYDLYSKDLSEKIISVRRMKAGQGQFITGFAPYGYQKSEEKRLIPDRETGPIVRRIFEMAAEGVPQTHIARRLNQEGILSPVALRKKRGERFYRETVGEKSVWSCSTVSRILKDQRYMGDSVYGKVKPVSVGSRKDVAVPKEEWIIVPDSHEPLVSREVFEKVNGMGKKHSKRTGSKAKETAVFAGKVYCGSCNHMLSRKHGRYRCFMPSVTDEYRCFQESIREKELEEAVLSTLQRLEEAYGERETREEADGAEQERKAGIQRIEQELSQCETEIMRLKGMRHGKYEEYKNGRISRERFIEEKRKIDKKEEGLAAERERMEKELCEAKAEGDGDTDEGRMIRKFAPFKYLTREMVETFVRRVVILEDGSVRLEWNFEDFCRFSEN